MDVPPPVVRKTDNGVVTNYVYNIEDRLTEVWEGDVGTGSLIASYYYDPFGRRLWKDVGETRTYFLYADEGLIGEYDDSGQEIKTYGYMPGATWTTDPLFMKVSTEYYFYQNDHLGTPQKMTSVNGSVVWNVKYSSFGKVEIDIFSTITNNLRFSGQHYDEETGFYYNWHRFYNSQIGRYLRKDPIGLKEGINVYLYVNNNPITYNDPMGLWKYKAFCRYISGGEVGGGGVLKCHVTGPCLRNNKQEVGMIKVILVGVTGLSPGGWTYFSMELDDRGRKINPSIENLLGSSHVYSLGWAFGGWGKSYANIKIGSTYYEGRGDQTGFDLSGDAMWGNATWNDDVPLNNWWEDCCYDEN